VRAGWGEVYKAAALNYLPIAAIYEPERSRTATALVIALVEGEHLGPSNRRRLSLTSPGV
jgi:hypothetical protein